jgi:acyl-CoA reductase-like NAD-dependent aldehyde dehydrogenase
VDKDRVGKNVPEFKLFVGGHWLAGQEWFEVKDKVSGDILGTVPQCEDEMYEMAIMAARDSGSALARIPAERRAAGLRRWADSLLRARDTLAAGLHRETAIPLNWALLEVDQSSSLLKRLAAECERTGSETVSIPREAHASLTSVDFSLCRPVGTVAALLPDRHPLFYAAQLTGAAIASGCPIILKAGPLAPLTAKQFMEQGAQLSWPPGCINLIYGANRELGTKLAADMRVGLLALGGYIPDREALMAMRSGRPTLIAGTGFGCALLDRNADVAQTTTRLLSLRFRSPQIGRAEPFFVLVPQALAGRLGESLAAGLAALKGANVGDAGAEVPHQISDNLAQRVEDWLSTVQQAGAIVSYGGQRHGAYVEPIVLTAPAGYREIAAPPPTAPVFIIDSYDKQPERHLTRIPELDEVYIFAGSLQAALDLARLPDVRRVEVFPDKSGPAPLSQEKPHDHERLRQIMAGMTRRKWVGVHLSG